MRKRSFEIEIKVIDMTEETSEPETVAWEYKWRLIAPGQEENNWKWRTGVTRNIASQEKDHLIQTKNINELIRRQDVIELLEERIEELNEMLEECDDREESKVIMLYLDEAENLKQKLKGENDGS